MNNERFIRDCRSSPSPFASHLPRRGHRFHRILNGAARTRLAMIALRLLSSTGFSLEFRSTPRTWSSAVSLPLWCDFNAITRSTPLYRVAGSTRLGIGLGCETICYFNISRSSFSRFLKLLLNKWRLCWIAVREK